MSAADVPPPRRTPACHNQSRIPRPLTAAHGRYTTRDNTTGRRSTGARVPPFASSATKCAGQSIGQRPTCSTSPQDATTASRNLSGHPVKVPEGPAVLHRRLGRRHRLRHPAELAHIPLPRAKCLVGRKAIQRRRRCPEVTASIPRLDFVPPGMQGLQTFQQADWCVVARLGREGWGDRWPPHPPEQPAPAARRNMQPPEPAASSCAASKSPTVTASPPRLPTRGPDRPNAQGYGDTPVLALPSPTSPAAASGLLAVRAGPRTLRGGPRHRRPPLHPTRGCPVRRTSCQQPSPDRARHPPGRLQAGLADRTPEGAETILSGSRGPPRRSRDRQGQGISGRDAHPMGRMRQPQRPARPGRQPTLLCIGVRNAFVMKSPEPKALTEKCSKCSTGDHSANVRASETDQNESRTSSRTTPRVARATPDALVAVC